MVLINNVGEMISEIFYSLSAKQWMDRHFFIVIG